MIGHDTTEPSEERAIADEQSIRRLTVTIPGSTANLGPGFDSLALALNLHCRLTFHVLAANDPSIPLITLRGRVPQDLSKDQDNLIYTILSDIWPGDREILKRVRITIESDIPLGKGLGSSAAAIVGAVWAAHALCNHVPDHGTLLAEAAQLEGHADNASASLLGGLTVCARSIKSRRIITQKVVWPSDWRPLVVVPQYILSTKKARSVLPKSIKMDDAVNNVQRVSLLMSAVTNRDEEAMQEALHDRLHEPYRLPLVPELGAIRRLLSDFPILGCVLSGAGPSVLTIVQRRHERQVLACLREWSEQQPEPPEVYSLEVDQEGLRVSYE